MGLQLAGVKIKQEVKRIVDCLAGPIIAVVPITNNLAIQICQLMGKNRIEIAFSIITDRGIPPVNGNIQQIIEPRKQIDLGEFADTRKKDKFEMGIAVFEHRVNIAQPVTHLQGQFGLTQIIENGLCRIRPQAPPPAGRYWRVTSV